MASHVVVFDTSMRRVQIRTTPGKHLSDVLQEACAKWGLNPDQYSLKHNNKPVDLSNMLRHSGLVSGAKLDLVQQSRSPSVVSVALQLPDSEGSLRLTHKFASNTPIWQILRQFEEGVAGGANNPRNKLNLTQRGVPEVSVGMSGQGRMCYEQPVVQVMTRELASTSDLQKTLAQLGFNGGSTLLRLNFRKTQRPLEDAMAEISQYFQAMDAVDVQQPSSHGVHAVPGGGSAQTPIPNPEHVAPVEDNAGFSNPPEIVPMEDAILSPESTTGPSESTIPEKRPAPDSATPSSEPTGSDGIPDDAVVGPSSRLLQVFSPSSNTAIAASRFETSDADYIPDVDHLRSQQQRLAEGGRNQRLKSDAEFEAEQRNKQEKLRAITKVDIDVRLPDGWRIRSTFGKQDTGTMLYAWARELLEHQDEPFVLQFRGPEGKMVRLEDGPKKLIEGYRLERKQLVIFVWGEQASAQARRGPVLKEVWRDKGAEMKLEPPASEQASPNEPMLGKPEEQPKGNEKGRGGDKEGRLKSLLRGLSKK